MTTDEMREYFEDKIFTALEAKYPDKSFDTSCEITDRNREKYRLYVDGVPTKFIYIPSYWEIEIGLFEESFDEVIDRWLLKVYQNWENRRLFDDY